MFHWICPECGREIAPQAKECTACEPQPAALAEPTPVSAEPAPLQSAVAGSPRPPAPAILKPQAIAGQELSPEPLTPAAAQMPSAPATQSLRDPAPASAPRITKGALREPRAAATAPPPAQASTDPEAATASTALPTLGTLQAGTPTLADPSDYGKIAAAGIRPAAGKSKTVTSEVQECFTLPGPTLPHELTTLTAAGVAQILAPSAREVPAKRSNWILSLLVAAAVFAGTLGSAFYAMPGLANAPAPAQEVSSTPVTKPAPETQAPTDPLARLVEVTGVRFVTDLPGRPPEIHYLVINHSNVPLLGMTVNVTLRTEGNAAPLSQFSFKSPQLGPYESKEMVSSIERFNQPTQLPDWRTLRTEVQIAR